jgi:hypothetical protein
LGIGRSLITKIHTRRQTDIDTARRQPKIDVRRHGIAALAADYTSRLDSANCIKPSAEVRSRPGPAAEALIEGFILLLGRMIVATSRIRLPCLYQDILGDVAGAIEDSPFDDNPLACNIRTGDVAAEIVLEDFKARLCRYETNVHIRACRL